MPNHNHSRCEICGENAVFHVPDGDLCRECHDLLFFRCNDCGNEFRILARHSLGDARYCDECYHEHVFVCDECGGEYDRRIAHEFDGQHLCNDCYRRMANEGVSGYHHHRYPSYNDDELRLGFELEAGGADSDEYEDCVRMMCEHRKDHGKKFVMEHDGSIPDCGFETISYPYTMSQYHNDGNYWYQTLEILRGNGLHASKECGLHIHASRAFMSSDQWYLAGWFIVSNRPQFEALCRRSSTYYACYSDAEDFDAFKRRMRDPQHYDAINYGSGKPTIEFRMFASTTNATTLFEDLELIDALCRFIKDADNDEVLTIIEDPDKAFNAFKRFINENNYKDAKNLINRKGV